jgi:hypothetical protein
MSKPAADIAVLTANRLGDGIVVFLGADGSWTESMAAAAVARSRQEAEALEQRGRQDAARNLVVDPYLVALREVDGRLEPVRYREHVRVSGPSVPSSVPSPRVGEGQGGGDGRTAALGISPTPVVEAA